MNIEKNEENNKKEEDDNDDEIERLNKELNKENNKIKNVNELIWYCLDYKEHKPENIFDKFFNF